MKRTSHPIDKYVGNRVRMRRLMLDMSQTELADAIGITFQQVQKYEKGTNRISASRLAQIAKTLQVSISFFFENVPLSRTQGGTGSALPEFPEVLATADGLALVNAYIKITNPNLRRQIVRLVEEMADVQPIPRPQKRRG